MSDELAMIRGLDGKINKDAARAKYDENRLNAMDRYDENLTKYGEGHYLTVLSKMSFQLICRLEECFEAIQGIKEAMETIDGVFRLMDDSMKSVDELLAESLNNADYSYKGRRAIRKLQRKYVKQISGRFKALGYKVSMMVNITGLTMKEVGKMVKVIDRASRGMSKADPSVKVPRSKKGAPAAAGPEFGDPKIQAMIDARRKERGQSTGGATGGGSSAPSAPKGGEGSGSVGGFDDIFPNG